jgi:hypothetical protein
MGVRGFHAVLRLNPIYLERFDRRSGFGTNLPIPALLLHLSNDVANK